MSNANSIDCGEHLDVQYAETLRARLLAALADRGPIVLSAGGVMRADAAGLQLLIAFVRSARTTGVDWSWQAVSPALSDAARLLGVARELDLPAD